MRGAPRRQARGGRLPAAPQGAAGPRARVEAVAHDGRPFTKHARCRPAAVGVLVAARVVTRAGSKSTRSANAPRARRRGPRGRTCAPGSPSSGAPPPEREDAALARVAAEDAREGAVEARVRPALEGRDRRRSRSWWSGGASRSARRPRHACQHHERAVPSSGEHALGGLGAGRANSRDQVRRACGPPTPGGAAPRDDDRRPRACRGRSGRRLGGAALHDRGEDRAAGGVGVLVGVTSRPRARAASMSAQRVVHEAPVRAPQALWWEICTGTPALSPIAIASAHGVEQAGPLVAHVGRVEPARAAQLARQRDDLVGRA